MAASAQKSWPKLKAAAEKVLASGRRVAVTVEGTRVVVVPEEDVALLEAIEEFLDIKDVKRRRSRASKRGETPLPYERVRKQLGMRWRTKS